MPMMTASTNPVVMAPLTVLSGCMEFDLRSMGFMPVNCTRLPAVRSSFGPSVGKRLDLIELVVVNIEGAVLGDLQDVPERLVPADGRARIVRARHQHLARRFIG